MKKIMFLVLATLVSSLCASPLITVTDTKGRSLSAELVSVTETHATVKRASDDKVFKLPLKSLDAESIKLIKEKAEDLPEVYPELDVKVTIGKRRVKTAKSYYMKTQTITTAVTIKNTDLEIDFPKCSARVVYIGQNKKNPDQYKILSTNDFHVAPKANKTAEAQLPSFTTTYDSDNEGAGNIGGFQYEGYLLIIWDAEKNVILHKTTNATIAGALKSDYSTLGKMITARTGTFLSKNLAFPSLKKPHKPILVE